MRHSASVVVSNTDGFTIAFSTKAHGNMLRTNANRIEAIGNRVRFLAEHDIAPDDVFLVRTSDSANIDVLTRPSFGISRDTFTQRPVVEADFDYFNTGADGIITLDRRVAIGLLSGDCVPLIIWEARSKLHGIMHIGLLGALNGIALKLPDVLRSVGVDIGAVKFYVGPSISQRNYNVSRSGVWAVLREQAYENVRNLDRYIATADGDEFFDLPGMVTDQLAAIGAKRDQIARHPGCTAEFDSPFPSHHLQKQGGGRVNFYSVIAVAGAHR